MTGVYIFKSTCTNFLNIIPSSLFQNNFISTGLKITKSYIIFKEIHQISECINTAQSLVTVGSMGVHSGSIVDAQSEESLYFIDV